jgi:hypothetical protein
MLAIFLAPLVASAIVVVYSRDRNTASAIKIGCLSGLFGGILLGVAYTIWATISTSNMLGGLGSIFGASFGILSIIILAFTGLIFGLVGGIIGKFLIFGGPIKNKKTHQTHHKTERVVSIGSNKKLFMIIIALLIVIIAILIYPQISGFISTPNINEGQYEDQIKASTPNVNEEPNWHQIATFRGDNDTFDTSKSFVIHGNQYRITYDFENHHTYSFSFGICNIEDAPCECHYSGCHFNGPWISATGVGANTTGGSEILYGSGSYYINFNIGQTGPWWITIEDYY